MRFGLPEILLIVLALVLLFGASRLPQLARSIGRSRKAFKEGLQDAENDAVEASPEKIDASGLSDEEILAEMERRKSKV